MKGENKIVYCNIIVDLSFSMPKMSKFVSWSMYSLWCVFVTWPWSHFQGELTLLNLHQVCVIRSVSQKPHMDQLCMVHAFILDCKSQLGICHLTLTSFTQFTGFVKTVSSLWLSQFLSNHSLWINYLVHAFIFGVYMSAGHVSPDHDLIFSVHWLKFVSSFLYSSCSWNICVFANDWREAKYMYV